MRKYEDLEKVSDMLGDGESVKYAKAARFKIVNQLEDTRTTDALDGLMRFLSR